MVSKCTSTLTKGLPWKAHIVILRSFTAQQFTFHLDICYFMNRSRVELLLLIRVSMKRCINIIDNHLHWPSLLCVVARLWWIQHCDPWGSDCKMELRSRGTLLVPRREVFLGSKVMYLGEIGPVGWHSTVRKSMIKMELPRQQRKWTNSHNTNTKIKLKWSKKKLLNYQMDETQQLHEQYFRFPIM